MDFVFPPLNKDASWINIIILRYQLNLTKLIDKLYASIFKALDTWNYSLERERERSEEILGDRLAKVLDDFSVIKYFI